MKWCFNDALKLGHELVGPDSEVRDLFPTEGRKEDPQYYINTPLPFLSQDPVIIYRSDLKEVIVWDVVGPVVQVIRDLYGRYTGGVSPGDGRTSGRYREGKR